MTSDYMTEDQRFASRRTDVLVYQTPPLEQDLIVIFHALSGPVDAHARLTKKLFRTA
jgi:uncharacterized protein